MGDNEVCLRAGTLADGSMLVAAVVLGYDPMDTLPLYLEKEPKAVRLLLADGTYRSVDFRKVDTDVYEIDARVESCYPAFIIVE